MTINIEGSALSIPKSLDSLKTTPLTMHRITFEIAHTSTWYAIMKEARALYGTNWRGQPHVKRKLDHWGAKMVPVWFEVPDPVFATWVAVKHAVIVHSVVGK